MTNAQTAIVTVTDTAGEQVFGSREVSIADAQALDVAAGHLHVVGGPGKGRTAAVYAPGFWQSARLTGAQIEARDITDHYLRPALAAAGVANPERYTAVYTATPITPAADALLPPSPD